MNLLESQRRWSQMLAQAAHLAELDNTVDAVARARACLRELEAEIERASDDETRQKLKRIRGQAEAQTATLEEAHSAWTKRVEERGERYVEREQEVYNKPLPLPGID